MGDPEEFGEPGEEITPEPEGVAEPEEPQETPVEEPNEIDSLKTQLAEAQRMIGSQGQELGLLREYQRQQTAATTGKTDENVLVSEDDVVNLMDDPAGVLNTLARNLHDRIVQGVATMIDNQNRVTQYGQQVHNAFYAANPELEGYKDIVTLVAQQVAQENPNADQQTLLTTIAARAKERLETLQGGKKTTKASGSGGGGKTTSRPPKKSESDQEFDRTLNSSFGG